MKSDDYNGANPKSLYYLLLLPVLLLFPLVSTVYAQTNNTSSSAATTFSTYQDPEGRFTIQYPSDFKVTPASNRFEKIAVELAAPEGSDMGLFAIAVKRTSVVPFDPETSLKYLTSQSTIPNFESQEDVECSKYVINGKKACSTVFTRTTDYTSDFKYVVMSVVANIKKSTYILEYNATPDNFDKNLPLADKIIRTFHALK